MTGVQLADAAETLVGAPFRLHGRDRATGLDCLGVVAVSLAACGRTPSVPTGYGLHVRAIDRFLAAADAAGLRQTEEAVEPGDVVLVRPAPGQHHLLVARDGWTFIHAHAGLRRVVAMPGPLPWPVLRRWRLASRKESPWQP